LKKSERSLEFDAAALEDLAWWVAKDRKKALRLLRMIQETHSDPFGGVGKPEPLKHELAGCWSKRIDQEHRLSIRFKNPGSVSSHAATITIEPNYVSRLRNFAIARTNAARPIVQRISECSHSSLQPAPRRMTPRAASISHVVGNK
jgi:toxin YoeB